MTHTRLLKGEPGCGKTGLIDLDHSDVNLGDSTDHCAGYLLAVGKSDQHSLVGAYHVGGSHDQPAAVVDDTRAESRRRLDMDDRGENNVSGIGNRFLTKDEARRFDQDQVDRGGCRCIGGGRLRVDRRFRRRRGNPVDAGHQCGHTSEVEK